jgi:hypothetical protein
MNIFEGGRRIAMVVAAYSILAGMFGFDGVPLLERAQNLAIFLVAYAAFVWTTGWIVRGFMGIPRGHDQRADK